MSDWWEFDDGPKVRAAAAAQLRAHGTALVPPEFNGHCGKPGGCGFCDRTIAEIRKQERQTPTPVPAKRDTWPEHWEAAS